VAGAGEGRPGHLVAWRAVEWLDLVVPSVAILALFAAIGLIVTAIRQGRAIRRLEERLAKTGDAAVEAPLQRIADLQARHTPSSRAPGIERPVRIGAVIGVSALILIAAIGGVWYLLVRDDGGSASADTGRPAATQPQAQQTQTQPRPVDPSVIPAEVPQIDKTAATVAVFNSSGIDGVAGDIVGPALENEGYQVPLVDNPPDGDTDRRDTVVMYARGNRKAAQNVAKDLGIDRAPPLDGYTAEQVGNADVVVLVGLDIANGGIAAATP